jgi:pilus assembly protein CpaE
MAKYKVLAVVSQEEKRLQLRQLLARAEDVALIGFAHLDADLMTKIKGYAPHVVLLVQEQGEAGLLELAQRIYQGFPGCAVALLVPSLEIDLVRRAMQAGVRQIISEDNLALAELNHALVQAAMVEQGRSAPVGGDPRVVAFYSGKGGVGRTTAAVNLAVTLASSGRRTALIDLNLAFGDAALLLNLNARDTIAELVQEKTAFLIEDIKGFCLQHPSGLAVLSAPSSPELAEYITARHVEMILSTMRPYYDFIIVDLPNDLSESTLTAMENADDIYLVAHRDIASLRSLKMLASLLATLQQAEKLHVLLNADHPSIVNHKDFERILGFAVDHVLPDDAKLAQQSQERGVPLVLGFPHSPLARSFAQLGQSLVARSAKGERLLDAERTGKAGLKGKGKRPMMPQSNQTGNAHDQALARAGAPVADQTAAKPKKGLFGARKKGQQPSGGAV